MTRIFQTVGISTSRALVWLKRNLRLHDHAPLAAARDCYAAAGVFIIEPERLTSPEWDPTHFAFALDSLAKLRNGLARCGLPLLVHVGLAVAVLARLQTELG